MKFRIISVKKRPSWVMSINKWQAEIETEDKKRYKFNCWAGGDSGFNRHSLLIDLKEKIEKEVIGEDNKINNEIIPLLNETIDTEDNMRDVDEKLRTQKLKFKEVKNK